MGLSVCGVVMQAIVKNPLADPYVLGVSSGAYLGATLAMLLGLGTILGGSAMACWAAPGPSWCRWRWWGWPIWAGRPTR